ncbi:glycoside hydrolase family 16 protein [Hymenobacter antarcticus]|uniref:GH16 domain-containing protein n=1 Tax=Hymenobacter antarcticus TaxID=486270 RepID=A0ABP7P143_9BACT
MRKRIAQVIALLLVWHGVLPASAQQPINYADWHLEWAEEFNAPVDTLALTERWRFSYPWGRALANSIEVGYYTARELQASAGVLNMTLHRLAEPLVYRGRPLHYTASMLFSRHLIDSLRPANCHPEEGFSYGLFEVRARQPASSTSAPAFWLFGGVPDEVDVFEADANVFSNTLHLAPGGYWRPTRQQEQTCQCLFYNTDPAGNLHEQFHTYGVKWMPDGIVFYYDGVPIRHETRLLPAGCAMAVIVNMTALAWATHPADTLALDYIRIYRPRHLPPPVAVLRPGGDFPQSELAWLPAETQPGRPDQAMYQAWNLAPSPRAAPRLALQLTDNYNPACDLFLPLPIAGRWAPAWTQIAGTPELRISIPKPDSVAWAVHDLLGRLVAGGTTAGGGTWRPRWAPLPPGAYAVHLRQGQASVVHPLTVLGRPDGSAPTAIWRETPAPAPEP